MDSKPDNFDRKMWNKKLSSVMNEHPELNGQTVKTEVYSDKGAVRKVKIKEKTI